VHPAEPSVGSFGQKSFMRPMSFLQGDGPQKKYDRSAMKIDAVYNARPCDGERKAAVS
jgi:hypothetical protein